MWNVHRKNLTDKEIKDFDTKITFEYILARDEISRLAEAALWARPVVVGFFTFLGSSQRSDIFGYNEKTHINLINLSDKKITRDATKTRHEDILTMDMSPWVAKLIEKLGRREIITSYELKILFSCVKYEGPEVKVTAGNMLLDDTIDFSSIVMYNKYGNVIGVNLSGLIIDNIVSADPADLIPIYHF